jgi:hypothetical protein
MGTGDPDRVTPDDAGVEDDRLSAVLLGQTHPPLAGRQHHYRHAAKIGHPPAPAALSRPLIFLTGKCYKLPDDFCICISFQADLI